MAVVGQLLSLNAETGWAVMEVDGVPRHVSLALLLVEGNPSRPVTGTGRTPVSLSSGLMSRRHVRRLPPRWR